MDKEKNNTKILLSIVIVLLIILIGVGAYFIFTKDKCPKDKEVSKTPPVIQNEKPQDKKEEVKDNKDNNEENIMCYDIEKRFNNISVKVNRKMENDYCIPEETFVNNKKIDIGNNYSGINSVELIDDNLFFDFDTAETSKLIIYNISNNKVIFDSNNNLPKGHQVFYNTYYLKNNKIMIDTVACSFEQCGPHLYDSKGNVINSFEKNEKMPTITYEMEYKNGVFTNPKMIENYTWK